MRHLLGPVLALFTLITPALAQEARTESQWSVLNDINSAYLAVQGWTLAGTTSMAAGPETGLLITFWQADDGTMVRCIFSLVSRTGAQAFETCSLAQAANGDTE